MTTEPQPPSEWDAAYARVRALATTAGETGLQVQVPATPAWTARELLAHMIGVGHDALGEDSPDDHNDDWTQGHVVQRQALSLDELLAAWAEDHDAILDLLAEDPAPLGDLIIHEQDLRGALGEPGARDTAGLAMVRDTMAEQFAETVGDRGPVRLESPEWTWQTKDGEPSVVLEASGFDLFRALVSRRSADELRSWVTAGDIEPVLDAFAGLGELPEKSLGE